MPSPDREKRRAAWRRWYVKHGGKNPERSNPITRLAVRTREEVAAALGVSIETVRLDEQRALAKLRRHPEAFEDWLEPEGGAEIAPWGAYRQRLVGMDRE